MKEGWRAVQSSDMMVWFFAEGKQKSWKHCGRSGVCLGGHPERIVKENTGRKAWGQQGQYFSWFFQYLFFWRKYAHQEEHLLLQAAEEQHKQWQQGRSALPMLLGYSVTRLIFRVNQDIYQVTKLYCEMNSWLRGSSEQGQKTHTKGLFLRARTVSESKKYHVSAFLAQEDVLISHAKHHCYFFFCPP